MDGSRIIRHMVFRNDPQVGRQCVFVCGFVLGIQVTPVPAVVAVKEWDKLVAKPGRAYRRDGPAKLETGLWVSVCHDDEVFVRGRPRNIMDLLRLPEVGAKATTTASNLGADPMNPFEVLQRNCSFTFIPSTYSTRLKRKNSICNERGLSKVNTPSAAARASGSTTSSQAAGSRPVFRWGIQPVAAAGH
jgi:hypothetical protein